MAKILMLGQRHPGGHEKVGVRGFYTQKKTLWAAMQSVVDPTTLILRDDVTGKEIQASYNGLCDKLRRAGRACLVEPDGKRLFLVVEGRTNELREWDVDEEGKPRYNPTPEKADDGEEPGKCDSTTTP